MYEQIKPWRDFTDQVGLLQQREMRIDDVQRAENYLSRIGYYRLSGYFHVFRQWDGKNLLEQFRPNSDFETVLSLYLFDKKLRLLALDALERIEMAVRVDIVYILGKQDPMAHENPACFDGRFVKSDGADGNSKSRHDKWLERLNDLIEQAQRRKIVCVEHNLKKYGKLPIWAVSGLWDFGAMSRLYEGMKHKDQNKIAQKYRAAHGGVFAKWLRSLNEIRNIAAHHDRLWNIRIVQQSPLNQTDEFWEQLENTRPFFYFCIMQQMMNILCPNSQWSERFDELLKEFNRRIGGKISLAPFGLIENYREWPLWNR